MTVWRLHIRPKGGDCNAALSTQFCLDNSIVGMGWAVSDADQPSGVSRDWNWYKTQAAARFGNDRSWYSVWNFATEVQNGDLVWFRHVDGTYFVAEITGPWQYRHEGGHIRPDIVNFRPARIVRVGLADAVPGSICSAFVPARTLQKIARPGMEEFSAACVGRDVPSIAGADLFGFLSPTDIENLVAVYLQTLGWLIIPGSRRADTPHYEYVLVNSATGERAIAQVKSGAVPIDAGAFAGELKVFLFAASGAYGGDVPINVRVLARAELEKFIRARPELLPRAVSTWMEAIGWS